MKKYFRALGQVEGLSLLILLFLAMPLKYMFDRPEAVRVVGMAHGILFLMYTAMVLVIGRELKWSYPKIAFAWVIASVPFGPFVFDKKLFGPRS